VEDHPVTSYLFAIAWSNDDGAFIAEIPDLLGRIADGSTPEEALREVLIVEDLWLEVAREDGRPLPAPSRRLVGVTA